VLWKFRGIGCNRDLAKKPVEVEVVPTFQAGRLFFPADSALGAAGRAAQFARLLQGSFLGSASPVFGCGRQVFFAPDLGKIAVQYILDVARIENVKGNLARPATQLDGSGSGTFQPAVLQPAMAFGGLDGEDVLDLAGVSPGGFRCRQACW
jgi:hypothetical protein